MSTFPCSLTRLTITSPSMKNLAFHSLPRWKMIILPLLATSLIQFWDNEVLFELRSERVIVTAGAFLDGCRKTSGTYRRPVVKWIGKHLSVKELSRQQVATSDHGDLVSREQLSFAFLGLMVRIRSSFRTPSCPGFQRLLRALGEHDPTCTRTHKYSCFKYFSWFSPRSPRARKLWNLEHMRLYFRSFSNQNLVPVLLAGVGVLITPGYVAGLDSIPVPGGALGQFFCRVIFSQYLVFTLGIVSVYTVTCMALDRWVAVARPTRYKTTLTRRRVKLVVLAIWAWSVLLNTPHLFEIKSVTTNGTATCDWLVLTTGATRKAVAILEFSGKFFLPVLVTFLTLLSVRTHVMASQALFKSNHGKAGLYLLRMCLFTALVLAISWLPNQVFYLLFKYDVTELNTGAHHFTVVLCMFNSTLNPWVCYASNKIYRRNFARVLCSGFSNTFTSSSLATTDSPPSPPVALSLRSPSRDVLVEDPSADEPPAPAEA